MALGASGKPDGPLPIPDQAPKSEGEAGGEGDGDGPVVLNVYDVQELPAR